MQSLIETLLTKFPEEVLSVDVDTARSEVTVHVVAPKILEIARFLHDDPEASSTISPISAPPTTQPMSRGLKSFISCCRFRTANEFV